MQQDKVGKGDVRRMLHGMSCHWGKEQKRLQSNAAPPHVFTLVTALDLWYVLLHVLQPCRGGRQQDDQTLAKEPIQYIALPCPPDW